MWNLTCIQGCVSKLSKDQYIPFHSHGPDGCRFIELGRLGSVLHQINYSIWQIFTVSNETVCCPMDLSDQSDNILSTGIHFVQ